MAEIATRIAPLWWDSSALAGLAAWLLSEPVSEDGDTFFRLVQFGFGTPEFGLAPRLFKPDQRLACYDWYDALPRLTDGRAQITIVSVACTEQALHRRFKAARTGGGEADFGSRHQSNRIFMTLEIARPDGARDLRIRLHPPPPPPPPRASSSTAPTAG